MELKDKKIAMFIADMFEDLEFWYPYLRMKEAGAGVVVIGPEEKRYTGKHGVPAKADKSIDAVNADDFDALIIPGGYSPDHMRRSEKMVEFVKKMNSADKTIAAICHAGWMLASADILKGRVVTGFYSIRDDIEHAGAKWVDREVSEDKNIITSRNPHDLPAFCKTIISSLSK